MIARIVLNPAVLCGWLSQMEVFTPPDMIPIFACVMENDPCPICSNSSPSSNQPVRRCYLKDPTTFEEQTVSDHFNYLEERVKKGIVLLAGRTLTEDEHTFGIVIFLAKDLKSAKDLAANDPAIINGVMRAEVLPFRISLPQNE